MTINLSLDQTLLTFALCVRKTWTTQLILVISLLGVIFLLTEKLLLLICMDSQFMWRKVFDSESVHCLSIRFCSYKRHFASFPLKQVSMKIKVQNCVFWGPAVLGIYCYMLYVCCKYVVYYWYIYRFITP